MSTVTTTNISDGATTVETQYVTHGSAKAWCNFNMVTAVVGDTFNYSSYIDRGVGISDLTYISNLADYGSASGTQFSNDRWNTTSWAAPTVTGFRVREVFGSYLFKDAQNATASVLGELA